ncbi:MAG: ATP-binding protein [Synergistaceae bacterium]|jgi:SpoVK/Ycf46/Vps4 family AAA+-type ATPase|nr:ATP-binding protein [Synergistaceae bacterium]
MAMAEQIKSLVKAHVEHDNEKFKTVVLQIAAHEAKLGHDKIARDLKTLIDKIGMKPGNILQLNSKNPMLELSISSHSLSELIVNDDIYDRIKRILNEYKNRNKLHSYGLTNRRKILIEGRPGTGKTLTASVIASELTLPLYAVQMDKLVTKFMGETSVKLRQVFDSIESTTGVYLFDEFDAIGADRSLDNEVGEMRRILNSFLQFIEQDSSDSIIIAATNNSKMLDQALFRRFDDVLHYSFPRDKEIERLFSYRLKSYEKGFEITNHLIEVADGLSQAEISRVCEDAIKVSILSGAPLTQHQVIDLIKERHAIYEKKEA